MTTRTETTYGNYFIVGMTGKVDSHSPYFGIPQDIVAKHMNDYGRYDAATNTFWTKVPAFIPEGTDRRWRPMGAERFEEYATVLVHCCDSVIVEVRKGVANFPEDMHLKSVPLMLPSIRMPGFLTITEDIDEAA